MAKRGLFKKNIAIALTAIMVFGEPISAAADTSSVTNATNADHTMTSRASDITSGLIGYYSFDDTLANGASNANAAAKLHGGCFLSNP